MQPRRTLRVGLFLGLVLHKLVWEIMRWRDGKAPPAKYPLSTGLRLVKTVKVGLLGFLLLQTLVLNVLPMRGRARLLSMLGVPLYLAGLLCAIVARVQLGRSWSNIEDMGADEPRDLVQSGPYRFVRHPIYIGDLLLLTGLELALNSWLWLGVTVPAVVVARQAVAEEQQLAARYPEYEDYRATTSRFIPFLW